MTIIKLLKLIKRILQKYNNFINFISKNTLNKYDKDAIYIEISGCCNAGCSYCGTGVGKHRPKTKFMTPDTFEKIIKHLIDTKILNKKIKAVNLYNFGEPFIHPYLNEILTILRKYNLKAVFSTNFIKFPEISAENYQNIYAVIFSLCSFDNEKYKNIYKADLDKVLENFNKFLIQKQEFNPLIKMSVHWLKYNFNKDEFNYAKKYFAKRKVYSVTDNYYAQLGDGEI